MKKTILISALLGLGSLSVQAEPMEIHPSCNTKLFKQLILSEKGKVKRAKLNPSEALKNLIYNIEMLCPMQIESDFNGDNIVDWIGVLQEKDKFYLTAYMSSPTGHRFSKIKQYDYLPTDQYLDLATEKKLLRMGKPKKFHKGVKFSVVDSIISGISIVYSWDGKKMKKLTEFQTKI